MARERAPHCEFPQIFAGGQAGPVRAGRPPPAPGAIAATSPAAPSLAINLHEAPPRAAGYADRQVAAALGKFGCRLSEGGPMDWKLELVSIPVSDVDRAKRFYTEKAGFHADHDHQVNDNLRFVQLTPPGSACSIALGVGIT